MDSHLEASFDARFRCVPAPLDVGARIFHHRTITKTEPTREAAIAAFMVVVDALKTVVGARQAELVWRALPRVESRRDFMKDEEDWNAYARFAIVCKDLEEQRRLCEVAL